VGYAGGTTPNPDYHNIGDYSETVQVDYDPTRVSYEQLLQAFWNGHDASSIPWSTQYLSIIFYHNDTQKAAVLKSKAEEEARIGREIRTAIVPYTKFYMAEDYHQKFNLRGSDIFSEISAIYPHTKDLVASTAAARLNGYLGGYGDIATVKAQVDQFGLSEAGQKELLELIAGGLSPACPAP
jgi:peptide-methionine (S)-S-oxide reductase